MIIVPKEMRPEMLQYIHEGHQGKDNCLLRARNTLATDLFYWKRMDFLIVADVFSKYILVWKLPNSTSAAVSIELSVIVTELGLPHIIRSDNDPCYKSKEFQQFLQCYSITHQTSSPNHPRSNGFVERMVGVAKKLMAKAGKEGKPWISGLFDNRVTPQSGSIVSSLQLMTQCTPREKNLPQLPSGLSAEKCIKPTRSSSKDKGTISLKGSTKNYSLVYQFGCNTGKMLHGNQQQW